LLSRTLLLDVGAQTRVTTADVRLVKWLSTALTSPALHLAILRQCTVIYNILENPGQISKCGITLTDIL